MLIMIEDMVHFHEAVNHFLILLKALSMMVAMMIPAK